MGRILPGARAVQYDRPSMSDGRRYMVNETRIVSEVIDGEAIIVNLANGYYYSLDTTAAEIWEWIRAGRSAAEIVAALRRRYDCAGADPDPAVEALIVTLTQDDLIASRTGPADEPALEPIVVEKSGTPSAPFRAPTLQRFSDMQGFLLVDPIHEVDDTGWPNVKPGVLPKSRG